MLWKNAIANIERFYKLAQDSPVNAKWTAMKIFSYYYGNAEVLRESDMTVICAASVFLSSAITETHYFHYTNLVGDDPCMLKKLEEYVLNVLEVCHPIMTLQNTPFNTEEYEPIAVKKRGTRVDIYSLEIGGIIGSGGNGSVYRTDDPNIVMKRCQTWASRELEIVSIREVCNLYFASENGIGPKFYGYRIGSDRAVEIFMENAGIELHKFIHMDGYKFSREDATDHIYQLLQTLKICHDNGLVHRDIKMYNVTICEGKITLCDWGNSRFIASSDKSVPLTDYVVTRNYRPPEILLKSNNYDESADIWTVGVFMTCYVMNSIFGSTNSTEIMKNIFELFGKPTKLGIYKKCSLYRTFQRLKPYKRRWESSHRYKKLLKFWGVDGLDLITSLLQVDPSKRLNVDQALNHPLFSVQNQK